MSHIAIWCVLHEEREQLHRFQSLVETKFYCRMIISYRIFQNWIAHPESVTSYLIMDQFSCKSSRTIWSCSFLSFLNYQMLNFNINRLVAVTNPVFSIKKIVTFTMFNHRLTCWRIIQYLTACVKPYLCKIFF